MSVDLSNNKITRIGILKCYFPWNKIKCKHVPSLSSHNTMSMPIVELLILKLAMCVMVLERYAWNSKVALFFNSCRRFDILQQTTAIGHGQ